MAQAQQREGIDHILKSLLPRTIYERLGDSDLAEEGLEVSIQRLVEQNGDTLQDTVKAKLQLLALLVGHLRLPLETTENIILRSDCLSMQHVVAQFWEEWSADPKTRSFAISVFEAEPTRTVAALVSSGRFNISPALQADCVATLNALAPTVNLLRDPLPSDHPVFANLDDPGNDTRKKALLRFISAIQNLCRVLIEPMQLPILMSLGFTSSEQIALAPLQSLQALLTPHGVSPEHSQRIHHQARDVLARSEASWLTMLQGAQDTSAPRVLQPWPATIKSDGPTENLRQGYTRAANNLSNWFGDLDEVGCKDCCSVTSPAAYFVDLLRMLKNQTSTLQEEPKPGAKPLEDAKKPPSLLDKLFERRPDLGDMLLSCRNTSDLVPYIDLVNETLESAVAYLHNREELGDKGLKLQVHNEDDYSIPTHQGSQLPRDAVSVRYDVYDDFISKKVYPSKMFPYDHSRDNLCRYLKATDSTESEVLQTFRADARLKLTDGFRGMVGNTKILDSVYARAHSAHVLGLSHADFVALTLESYYDLYGARVYRDNDSLTTEEYRKLAGLLPSWYYWGYEDEDPEEGDGEDMMLDSRKGDGLAFIKKQVLPRLGIQFSTLVDILRTRFIDGSLVVSLLPGGASFDTRKDVPTQLDGFRLRGRAGRPLDVFSVQRLDQFVRLWRRLGWSVGEVDDAISAFAGPGPAGRKESDQHTSVISPDTIENLAAVVEISKLTEIEPNRILALFSPFARRLVEMPVVRAMIAQGATLAKPSPESPSGDNSEFNLTQFLPLLLSSLNISYDDFAQIKANEQLGDVLTVRAVFTYNRMSECAKMLKVQSSQVSALLAILSEREAPLSTPMAYLKALRTWQSLQSDGWDATSFIPVAKGLNSGVTESSLNDNMIKFASSLLSLTVNDKERLSSIKSPSPSQSSADPSPAPSSAPAAAADQPIHSVMQNLFTNVPQDLIPSLLRTCRATDGTFYDSLIRLTEGVSTSELQGGFKGCLFFVDDTNIKIEGSVSEEKARILFGSSTIEWSGKTASGLDDKVLVEQKATKNSFVNISLPHVLSGIHISFLQVDGTPCKSPPHVISEDTMVSAQYVVDQLSHIDLVLARYSLDAQELEALTPGFLTSSQGLEALLGLQSYVSSRRNLSEPRQHKEFALLVSWLQSVTTRISLSDIAKRFMEATKLDTSTAEKVIRASHIETVLADGGIKTRIIHELARIGHQVKLLSKLGLKEDSIELLFQMAEPLQLGPGTAEKNGRPLTQFVQLLRASLINRGLKRSIETAQDELRDNRRKALIQYLLQNPALKSKGVFDEDSLFEFFLIDVQMGCGLDTTRIKQAISTVQLFVHRCLLGLEEGIESSLISQDRWSWMQKYNLWEANRKVFLYPENWVDPTLRDSKTQVFRSIENAVMQTNLDDKAICKMIRSYMYQADEISNLQIDAFYWDKVPVPESADGIKKETGEGSFHFVARTRTAPYQFWYRRLDYFSRGALPAPSWTSWEKLPLDVKSHDADQSGQAFKRPGSYIIPVVWRKRLIVFFPQITVIPEKDASKSSVEVELDAPQSGKSQKMNIKTPASGLTRLDVEVKMAWSEYIDSAWSPQKQSQVALLVKGESGKPPAVEGFRFNTVVSDETVSVMVYHDSGSSNDYAINTFLGHFTLQGPRMSFRPEGSTTSAPQFSKIQVPKTSFGAFEIVRSGKTNLKTLASRPSGSSVQEKTWPLLSKPPLDDSRDYASVTWTLDSGAGHNQPLGLVADVTGSDGPGAESWFTIPKGLATDDGSQDHEGFYSLPLFNSLSESLRRALASDEGVEEIYKVMDRSSITPVVPPVKDESSSTPPPIQETLQKAFNYSFGRFGFLAQCREDATPCAIYNWEAGFHLISLLTERLLSLQQFDLALKYSRLVFDPTGTNEPKPSVDGKPAPPWRPTWRFPPFRDLSTRNHGTIDNIMSPLGPSSGSEDGMATAILSWRRDPFKPHTVARGRPLAYMKRFIMKYIEALIAAGDVYFRQNSLEAMPLAIQRYVEASHVFGPTPEKLPELGKKRFRSYNDIENQINDFSNASVDLQLSLPYYVPLAQRGQGAGSASPQGMPLTRYFGVQANPEFMALRGRINDRLFKIRNSLDLNGNPRTLSLWDPPVDIKEVVAAAASGSKGNMALVLSGFSAVMPRQRFMYLIQKAYELCTELKQASAALLAAVEKKDGEVLQQMRSNHETGMQGILMEMKLQQKDEAKKGLEHLKEVRKAAVHRFKFFASLTGDDVKVPTEKDKFEEVKQAILPPAEKHLRLTHDEKSEIEFAREASQLNEAAASDDWYAAFFYRIPMPSINAQPGGVGASTSLPNIGNYFQQQAMAQRARALNVTESAQQLARISQFTRQLQDRRLQLNLAGREIKSVDKQIEVQNARIRSVEKDIEAQSKLAENAMEVQEFLRTKFTNSELYAWFEASARSYLYQTYLVTMELARKVELAYRFEQGPGARSMLSSTGYWDQGKSGLNCGEQLWFALKQMELSYLNETRHDFEMTKNVSLRQISPSALLSLRELGEATFDLPEALFDLDFPGHYFRRIKSVAISIHCVVGPHTTINCTATLMDHRYRFKSTADGDYQEQDGGTDSRFIRQDFQVPIKSVALSSAQQDPGVFDLNFNSENYQPFEGAGAISKWRLKLPESYRQFDYRGISDVVMHMRYTAKDGGSLLSAAATKGVTNHLKQVANASKTNSLKALIDARNDCSDAWFPFKSGHVGSSSNSRVLSLRNIRHRLPYFARDAKIKIQCVTVYVRGPAMTDVKMHISRAPEEVEGSLFECTDKLGELQTFLPSGDISRTSLEIIGEADSPWYLILRSENGIPPAPTDLFILIDYTLG